MAIKRQQSIREVKAAERSEQALALTRQTLQKKAKKSRRAHFLVLDPVLTAVGLTVGALAVALIFVPSGNPSTCIGDPDDSIESNDIEHSDVVRSRREVYRQRVDESGRSPNPLVLNMVESCDCVSTEAEFVYLDGFSTSVLAALTPSALKVGLMAKKYIKYIFRTLAGVNSKVEGGSQVENSRRAENIREHKMVVRSANEAFAILVLYASLGIAFWSVWDYIFRLKPRGSNICVASFYVSAIMYRPFSVSSFFSLGLVGDHVYWYIRDLLPESTRTHLTIDHPPTPFLSANVVTFFALGIVACLLVLWWGCAIIFVPLGIAFLPILVTWCLIPIALMYAPMKFTDWIETKMDASFDTAQSNTRSGISLRPIIVPEQFKVKAMIATMLCLFATLSSLSKFYDDGLWMPQFQNSVKFTKQLSLRDAFYSLVLMEGLPPYCRTQYLACVGVLVIYELFKVWARIYLQNLRHLGQETIQYALEKRKIQHRYRQQRNIGKMEEAISSTGNSILRKQSLATLQSGALRATTSATSALQRGAKATSMATSALQKGAQAVVRGKGRELVTTVASDALNTAANAQGNISRLISTKFERPSLELHEKSKESLLALYASNVILLYQRGYINGSRMSDDQRARLAADVGTWNDLDEQTFKKARNAFMDKVLEKMNPNLSPSERIALFDDVGKWEKINAADFDEAQIIWKTEFEDQAKILTFFQTCLIAPHKIIQTLALALASFINDRLFAREFEMLEVNSKEKYTKIMLEFDSFRASDINAENLEQWTHTIAMKEKYTREFLAASIQVYQSTGGGGMGGKPIEIESLDLSDLEQRRIIAELALLAENFDVVKTGALLDAVPPSPKLKSVQLRNCTDLTDGELVEGISRFPILEEILCEGCLKLTNRIFDYVGRYSEKGVRILGPGSKSMNSLANSRWKRGIKAHMSIQGATVGPEALEAGKAKTTNLLELINQVRNEKNLQFITTLNFSGCRNITDGGIYKLVNRKLQTLRHLDFSYCKLLTSASVNELIWFGGSIGNEVEEIGYESLNFKGCPLLTPEALLAFQDVSLNFKLLKAVNFSESPFLGDEAIKKFREDGFPKLISLDFSRTLFMATAVKTSKDGEPLVTEENEFDLLYPPGVTNEGLAHIKRLSLCSVELASIGVDFCTGIDNDGIMELTGVKKLRKLSISGTQCGDEGIRCICEHFPELHELNLSHCRQISDKGMSYFEKAVFKDTLVKLNLRECDSLDDKAWVHLKKIPNLEDISFHGCENFKKLGMRSILDGDLRHLRSLNVGSIGGRMKYIQDDTLNVDQLKRNRYLVSLNLGGTKISDDALNTISKSVLKQLYNLDLSWTRISDEGLQRFEDVYLQGNVLVLKELSTKGCRLVTDLGMSRVLVATGKTLTSLNLALVTGISNTFLASVRDTGLPLLESLNVSFTKVSDRGILMISERGLPMLQHLIVAGCLRLTADCLAEFGRTKSLRKLRTLNFFGCKYINDHAVIAFKDASLPYLVSINLGFTGVSESAKAILNLKKEYQLKSLDYKSCNLSGHGKKMSLLAQLKAVVAQEEKEEEERHEMAMHDLAKHSEPNEELPHVEAGVDAA